MKLLILLIVFSTLAFGTSVIPYSENQVIDKSDLIIRGVVEDKDTEVDAYMNRIFTSYKIKISEFMYPCDNTAGNECIDVNDDNSNIFRLTRKEGNSHYITLKTLGGVVGNIGMQIAGSPRFNVSQSKEYVFILNCREKKDSKCVNAEYSVVGFYQGLCDIEQANGEKILKCAYKEEGEPSSSVAAHGHVSSSSDGITSKKIKTLKSLEEKLLKRTRENN